MKMPKDAARKALELWTLQRQIMQMEAALARVRIDYNHIKNQFAPISSLPDEVLSAIFEAGCALPLSGSNCLPFEILVSQVSQHWRNVALSTSGLWANVVLKTYAPHHFEMADLYLHRSKVSALHLSIYIDREYSTIEGFTALCYLIFPHVGRWRRLYIDCDWRLGFEHFFDCLPSVAPILQRITIYREFEHGVDNDFDESDIPRRIFIDGAPNLTSISLRGITLQSCLPPLAAITSLRLDDLMLYPSIASLRSTLTGLPSLTYLVIYTDFFLEWEELESIELPLLRRLHFVAFEDFELISGMLTTISAPSLQHLLLENITWEYVSSLALAADFDSALEFPLLRSLTILTNNNLYPASSSDLTLSNWQLFFATFPTVTHVTLSHSGINTFLESLDEQTYPAESPLWPTLHTLTLLDQPEQLDVALIRTAVSARIALGHPLRKLQLSKAIMLMLKRELQWLRTHMVVEECTIYPHLADTSITNWPDENY